MAKLIKETVAANLDKLARDIPAPRKSNEAKALQDILIWQEISAIADKRLKTAWAEAQAEGIVPEDAAMREHGEGEHIIKEAGNFSCIAKVAAPGKQLNKDALIAAMVKKFKITETRAALMLLECSDDRTAALTKRVLEAS